MNPQRGLETIKGKETGYYSNIKDVHKVFSVFAEITEED